MKIFENIWNDTIDEIRLLFRNPKYSEYLYNPQKGPFVPNSVCSQFLEGFVRNFGWVFAILLEALLIETQEEIPHFQQTFEQNKTFVRNFAFWVLEMTEGVKRIGNYVCLVLKIRPSHSCGLSARLKNVSLRSSLMYKLEARTNNSNFKVNVKFVIIRDLWLSANKTGFTMSQNLHTMQCSKSLKSLGLRCHHATSTASVFYFGFKMFYCSHELEGVPNIENPY